MPAKLGLRQLVGPQSERRALSDIQVLLNSVPQVWRHGPVPPGARAGTNVASGGHIG